jgi:anti-sigma B factor antagonist
MTSGIRTTRPEVLMPQTDAHTVQEAADARPAALADHLPPSPFLCNWEAGCADGAWVQVAGELDLATTPQLRAALQEARAHARLVALDLRALTFIDTSGIHMVLDATAAAHEQEGRLILVRPPASVERVLNLAAARDRVQIIDLKPGDPVARALLHLT